MSLREAIAKLRAGDDSKTARAQFYLALKPKLDVKVNAFLAKQKQYVRDNLHDVIQQEIYCMVDAFAKRLICNDKTIDDERLEGLVLYQANFTCLEQLQCEQNRSETYTGASRWKAKAENATLQYFETLYEESASTENDEIALIELWDELSQGCCTTDEECDVLRFKADGYTITEIAEILDITADRISAMLRKIEARFDSRRAGR